MNDRLIRGGIIDSERVNSLSWAAECFYRRLQSLVDDYGNYDGREAIIRTNAFKLKLNQVSESDVLSWLQVCEKAELISFYRVEGKDYLHLKDFRQKKRWMKRQYPPCPEENEPPPKEEKRSRREDEEKPAQARHPLQIYVENNFKNVTKLRDQLTFAECERLVKDFDKRKIANMLAVMENKKGLANKYESVNLTLRNWLQNDFNNTNTTLPAPQHKLTQATLKHIGASIIMKVERKSGEIIGVEEGKYRIALTNGGEIIMAEWKEFIITASAPRRNMAEPTALSTIVKELRPQK